MSDIKKEAPVRRPATINGLVLAVLASAVLVLGGIYVVYALFPSTGGGLPAPAPVVKKSPPPAASFASFYEEVPVAAVPALKPYAVEPGLANVANAGDFDLPDAFKAAIIGNGFAVRPGYSREFFPLYEANRYNQVPNFVTVDAMMHNYHLMFDHLLEGLETSQLADQAGALTEDMLAASLRQLEALRGTAWETAARRNAGFFAVGRQLLDPAKAAPEAVAAPVQAELAQIAAHDGIHEWPLMGLGQAADAPPTEKYLEDYSQYVPRGHYDKSDKMRAYFRAMMWYGRLNFRFKNEDEVRSAVLMTLALGPSEVRGRWDAIYEPTAFFVGKSDDVDYYALRPAVEDAYGAEPALRDLAAKPELFAALLAKLKDLKPPQINSMVIFDERFSPDREKEIKGFRFMGQRFTPDASIFQRLIYREVKENAAGQGRYLPKGLDIPAAIGSDEALALLAAAGDTGYANYPENMAKMRAYVAGLKPADWNQNLYWSWLWSLEPLTKERPAGYPSFMTGRAWRLKSLTAYLGSWTELKHDTILYAKQVYAELGGGPGEEKKKDDRGYVEPEPAVYARLAALCRMTSRGLAAREMLAQGDADNLALMESLALRLKDISEKELAGTALSAEDYDLIRSFGGQIEHLWYEINRPAIEASGMGQRNYLDQNPAALVADVATDPNGSVLEEATGHVWEIMVAFPLDGQLHLASGGVYSYYEFPQPIDDRLTDAKWREMLDNGKAPEVPAWTSAYVVR